MQLPLHSDVGDPIVGAMFDRFVERRVVLVGEASRGTRKCNQARAAITRI
jgi:erythromycin esterase-like protein